MKVEREEVTLNYERRPFSYDNFAQCFFLAEDYLCCGDFSA